LALPDRAHHRSSSPFPQEQGVARPSEPFPFECFFFTLSRDKRLSSLFWEPRGPVRFYFSGLRPLISSFLGDRRAGPSHISLLSCSVSGPIAHSLLVFFPLVPPCLVDIYVSCSSLPPFMGQIPLGALLRVKRTCFMSAILAPAPTFCNLCCQTAASFPPCPFSLSSHAFNLEFRSINGTHVVPFSFTSFLLWLNSS